MITFIHKETGTEVFVYPNFIGKCFEATCEIDDIVLKANGESTFRAFCKVKEQIDNMQIEKTKELEND